MLDPKFKVEKQIAWTLLEFIKASKKFRQKPYRCIWLDEAVNLFFSRDAMVKANSILVKIFISNRSFSHFYLLNMPNFFYLEKYIREWRIKTLNYTWLNWKNPDTRHLAFYSKKAYKDILIDAHAKTNIIDPEVFVQKHKPSFIEKFSAIKGDAWTEYERQKERYQKDMMDDALEEVQKMEDRNKIGFHEGMDSGALLSWLHANYKTEGQKMRFTKQEAAVNACIAKGKMVNLVNQLYNEGLLRFSGRSEYEITAAGIDKIKENFDS